MKYYWFVLHDEFSRCQKAWGWNLAWNYFTVAQPPWLVCKQIKKKFYFCLKAFWAFSFYNFPILLYLSWAVSKVNYSQHLSLHFCIKKNFSTILLLAFLQLWNYFIISTYIWWLHIYLIFLFDKMLRAYTQVHAPFPDTPTPHTQPALTSSCWFLWSLLWWLHGHVSSLDELDNSAVILNLIQPCYFFCLAVASFASSFAFAIAC